MAVELGSAHVEIRATQDKLKKDLDGAHDSITGKLGGAMKVAAGAMALGAVAAGAAIAAVGVSSIQAASDVNESLSKVGVVFGENAGQITDWAATAATAMGISRGEALAASGTLGNLFVSMGLGSKDAAGLSMDMVELASDVGSFNNIASSDALEKLRAGLIGEAEPLRALGVNMNAAMVEAKGMELGLADANGELSEAAKVQARYAIIMEQTKTAQGDFARTSTGMANATKIIQASLGDLQVQIGDQLLPIIAPLISSFAQWLPTAIAASKPFLLEAGKVFAQVGESIGTVLKWIQDLAAGWQETSTSVSGETSALWGYIQPIFDALARNLAVFWEEIFPELQGAWTAVVAAVQRVTAAFGLWWDEHWTTIAKVLDVAMVVIAAVIDTTFSSIKTLISVVLNIIQGDWQGAWDAIRDHFGVVWNALKQVVGAVLPLIQEALVAAWEGIKRDFVERWAEFTRSVETAFSNLKGIFERAGPALMELLRQGIANKVDSVLGPIRKMVADVAALLPHSYADEGPLSVAVSWHDVLWGDLETELPALLAEFKNGTDAIAEQFAKTATHVSVSAAQLEQAMQSFGGGGGGSTGNGLLDAYIAGTPPALTEVSEAQQHAMVLNQGTSQWVDRQKEMTIELDGVAVGRAVAPYIQPEVAHFSGSRIGGV